MAEENRADRCPRCGSAALDQGRMAIDVKFHRNSQWFSAGWNLQAFICLDCGLLTQYLGPAELDKLRQKNGLRKRST